MELRSLSLTRSRSENVNTKSRIFTPTPFKNKCANLWDKISENGEDSFIGIPKCESENHMTFRNPFKIRKFHSYGRLELENNLHEEDDSSFESIREEHAIHDDTSMEFVGDESPEQHIPRASNPIIFDKLFCSKNKIGPSNMTLLASLPRDTSLNVN